MKKTNQLIAAALAATLVLGACDDGTDDDIDDGVDDGVTVTTVAPVPDDSIMDTTTTLGG